MARASLTPPFSEMKPFLYAALTGYVVAAIHAVLAFVNKRRAAERIAFYSVLAGFAAHTGALIVDWAQDGHYPLFSTPEALSFLAWTLVVAYWLVTYKYPVRAKALSFSFFLTDETSRSSRLFDGRTSAHATRKPQSSSVAKSARAICVSRGTPV